MSEPMSEGMTPQLRTRLVENIQRRARQVADASFEEVARGYSRHLIELDYFLESMGTMLDRRRGVGPDDGDE